MAVAFEREPVLPSEGEKTTIQELDELLTKKKVHKARLIGPDGESLILPDSVSILLARVVHDLAQGNAVTVIPVQAELTTQVAADLLNVSRPFLVKLLESGEIPFHHVGTHRRVRFKDVMAYKHRRDRERQRAIDDLARVSQELGIYD
ncbi:MAG: helix-turn-helix domain-containing protein [Chloroflexota bacterium]